MKPFAFIDLEGCSITQNEIKLLNHPLVAGLTLFARNYENQTQLKRLTDHIKTVNNDLLIAVDHEGGRVQRFRHGFTKIPSMRTLTQPDIISEIAWLVGSELRAFNIDINFAPVVDIDRHLNTVIGDRAFAGNPLQVASCADAYAKGLISAGIMPVAKHFPGHGGVALDSHLDQPIDTRSLDTLMSEDIAPFAQLINKGSIPAIMPSHVIYSAVDDMPACFSKKWIVDILRKKLDFNGLVISDDLSMKAAEKVGNMVDRIHQSLASGCNIVLICNYQGNLMSDLDQLAGLLTCSTNVTEKAVQIKIACDNSFTWKELLKHERWQKIKKIIEDINNATT